jgi:virginiamycin B lyase
MGTASRRDAQCQGDADSPLKVEGDNSSHAEHAEHCVRSSIGINFLYTCSLRHVLQRRPASNTYRRRLFMRSGVWRRQGISADLGVTRRASNNNIYWYCSKAIELMALLMVLYVRATAQSGAYNKIIEYPVPTDSSYPAEITSGPDGALWFAEYDANKIGRITTSGLITEYPVPTANSYPLGITVGPDGALWFTEEQANKIGRITAAGVITEYPVPTFASGPSWIKAGRDGAVWFTEYYGNKIGRITTGGEINEYPVPTAGGYPAGITAGPDGALWFSEFLGNKIGRITAGGAITEYPVPTANAEIVGITAGPDGALWFTEGQVNKIGRITTAGVITEYPTGDILYGPSEITAGPDGALWFSEGSAAIGRITTSGVVTVYPVPTASSNPFGITAGPDGALWFTEGYGGDKIARAPACGLGFSATFTNDTLTMHFHLAIDTPATFSVLLHTPTGVLKLFSQAIGATVPPKAFTRTWRSVPNIGIITVEPVLAAGTGGSGQGLCAEWTTVNTAQ